MQRVFAGQAWSSNSCCMVPQKAIFKLRRQQNRPPKAQFVPISGALWRASFYHVRSTTCRTQRDREACRAPCRWCPAASDRSAEQPAAQPRPTARCRSMRVIVPTAACRSGETRTETTVSRPAVSPAHTMFGRTRRRTLSAYPGDVAVPPAPLPVPLLASPLPLSLVPPPACALHLREPRAYVPYRAWPSPARRPEPWLSPWHPPGLGLGVCLLLRFRFGFLLLLRRFRCVSFLLFSLLRLLLIELLLSSCFCLRLVSACPVPLFAPLKQLAARLVVPRAAADAWPRLPGRPVAARAAVQRVARRAPPLPAVDASFPASAMSASSSRAGGGGGCTLVAGGRRNRAGRRSRRDPGSRSTVLLRRLPACCFAIDAVVQEDAEQHMHHRGERERLARCRVHAAAGAGRRNSCGSLRFDEQSNSFDAPSLHIGHHVHHDFIFHGLVGGNHDGLVGMRLLPVQR